MNEFIEHAKIVANRPTLKTPTDWFTMTLYAAKTAQIALPGNTVNIMGQELPLMSAKQQSGNIELLYQTKNSQTAQLAKKSAGEELDLTLNRKSFNHHDDHLYPLLISEDVGISAILFLASRLRYNKNRKPFIIAGFETTLPFRAIPSQFIIHGIPDGITATIPLLEDWSIPARLASSKNLPGCFDGSVTDLVKSWMEELPYEQLSKIEIFAFGNKTLLESCTKLALQYNLTCQTLIIHT